jgi:hypothetical protein
LYFVLISRGGDMSEFWTDLLLVEMFGCSDRSHMVEICSVFQIDLPWWRCLVVWTNLLRWRYVRFLGLISRGGDVWLFGLISYGGDMFGFLEQISRGGDMFGFRNKSLVAEICSVFGTNLP